MDSKKIGTFIKEKRIEGRMTEEELANKLHISIKEMENIENGKRIPRVEKLEPLARILGVTIAEILSGEKPAKDMDVLLKELENKNKRRVINLVIGIFICLFLCCLEAILYVSNVSSKTGYLIMAVVIILLLVLDIAYYFINKNK